MQTKDTIINFLKENKQIIQKKYAVNKIQRYTQKFINERNLGT